MDKTFFHATFLTNIFTGSPTFDLNGAIIHCLLLKIIFENIKYMYGKKNSLKKNKKNVAFNVGFQPYADHDIYRAIIFFNYMTFVEHIFFMQHF